MSDYISRDAAIETTCTVILHDGIRDALKSCINDIPAADVAPVVHGRWILIRHEEDGNALYWCSVCNAGECHVPNVEVSYCWNCGARMDGDADA